MKLFMTSVDDAGQPMLLQAESLIHARLSRFGSPVVEVTYAEAHQFINGTDIRPQVAIRTAKESAHV